jgi:hypothetical protein
MFHIFIQELHFQVEWPTKEYIINDLKHEFMIIVEALDMHIMTSNRENLKFPHLVSYEKNMS